MSAAVLRITGLVKAYPYGFLHRRRCTVLRGIDFTVKAGHIFGYLGPNGSGKTTTLKILMGLMRADKGEVSVFDRPLDDPAWRYRTGFLPEHPYLYDYLTAREYLDYVGRIFGLSSPVRRERSAALLERVGLGRSMDLPLRKFSKGMIQRASLAQALMNDPELVVLDEPMSGLDPLGRRLVRDMILELKAGGKTVLFSTHILSDAEALCDEVAVLYRGELLKVGPLSEILTLDVQHMEVLVAGVDGRAIGGEIHARQAVGERWRLEVPTAALGSVITSVEQAGGRILSVQAMRQSLEDFFFQALGPGTEAGHWSASRPE